jgi:hypothetical protein
LNWIVLTTVFTVFNARLRENADSQSQIDVVPQMDKYKSVSFLAAPEFRGNLRGAATIKHRRNRRVFPLCPSCLKTPGDR